MSNEPIGYRDQKDNDDELSFSTQSSSATAIYSPPSNSNIPVTTPYSPHSLNASSSTTGKTQVEIRNRRTAVSISSRLAKGEFAEVIKEKIKQGANANSQYQSLLEKLVDPHYKEHVEFLKEEMRRIQKETSNDDFQAYLTWLENKYDKIGHRATSGKFEEEAIDLYIREEREVQIKRWNVPNIPSHFIGREHLLEQLAQRLSPKENQTATLILTALHGLGGVGKTFLAARYAQLYAETYNFILWFNAENETTLQTDYRNFADVMHLPIEEQSPENIIVIVKNWLEQQSNWLIIYDNAPEDRLIAKFRPAKGGKILITSRKESWNKKDSLAIDVFSPEEARDYIVELTGFSLNEYQDKIDELANTLGYLPLALAQACAYISVNHLSLEDYLELYAESRAEMLADETMPAETSHEPVAITWHITFKAIEKQQLEASVLLESCAFLQGNSIPEFLLKELFAKQQSELAKQKKPFISALGCLQQYSMLKLISQEKKEKVFSLHNLVQEVIVDKLSTDKKQTYLLEIIKLLKSIFPYQEVEQIEDMAKQRELLPHMEKVLGRVEEWLSNLKKGQGNKELSELRVPVIEKEWYVPLLALSAHGYSNLGEARQQKALLERALGIQEQYYGKDHLEVAVTLGSLANAIGALGDAGQQKALLERALGIQEQYYGKDHSEVAITLGNLANALNALGEAGQQKALLERVLVIQEQRYGKDHPVVAHTLGSLATAIGDLGEAGQKKALLERALRIEEQHYGKDHPQVAATLVNLANAIGALGDAGQQKALLERALGIEEQHYGKDHLQVARTLNNLAMAIGVLGDAGQQKALLERALEIKEQHYGKNHPEVARTLANLGNALGALGDAGQQKALLERALEMQEKYYRKDHPEVAITLGNLAMALGALGEAGQQKALLERALEIKEQYYGKNHPEVARTLVNLGNALGALGDAGRQKTLLERALGIFEQHYEKDHLVVAVILVNLANALGVGEAGQQKALLERALGIFERYYGKDHPEVAVTLNNLASAYAKLGEWSTAKSMAERIYHIFSIHPNAGPQHPRTQAAKKRLDTINEVLAKYSPEQLSALQAHDKILVTEENSSDLAKALRNAANQNNVEKLNELLPQIANVNTKDEGQHGRTALHWAVIKQAFPCIKLLLTAGADAMMVDNAGKSSLDYAGESSNPDALFLLLSHQYKLPLENIEPGKLLRRAAHQNNVNDVKLLLKYIKSVNEKDGGNTQRTSLHWAVIQNATDCIKLLMAAGADPHLADGQSKTAYDYAKGNPDLFSLLQPIKSYYP